MRILIDHALLITQDNQRRIISDGALAVAGERIAYAGPRESLPAFEADRVIDGRDKLVMPGLINAHTHVSMTLLRSAANDLPLDRWLNERIWPLEAHLTEADIYWGAMLGILEMLRAGVTGFIDMYDYMHQVAQAAQQAGIRAMLGQGMTSVTGGVPEKLAMTERLIEDWNGGAEGRVRILVAPHAEYTCSEDFFRQCCALADHYGVGIHTHVSETCLEVAGCRERHGVSPVAALDAWGVFDRHTVAAHLVAVDAADIAILARKGVHVVHNPGSNLILGSGVMPLPQMLAAGVNLSLGTDGAASNNTLDIWKEIGRAATLHKGVCGDATAVSPQQALDMATRGGAAAMGQGDTLGSLEAGKQADLILVDLDKPHYHPRHDILRHLAYAGNSQDVCLTMVAGRVVMEDGVCPGLDAREIYAHADAIGRRLTQND